MKILVPPLLGSIKKEGGLDNRNLKAHNKSRQPSYEMATEIYYGILYGVICDKYKQDG